MDTKWADVLSTLRKDYQYDGGEDLASVKSFVKTEERVIQLTDSEDKTIDLDAAFKNQPEVKRAKITPAPEVEKKTVKVSRAIEVDAKAYTENKGPAIRCDGEKSAYKAKIRDGKAAFEDVDTAEAFGAWARIQIAQANRLSDYSQKDNDLDIIGKVMTGTVNASGGALVPTEFVPSLIYLTEQYGVAKKVANVTRMTRDVQSFPRLCSIQSFAFAAQGGSISAGDPGLDNVELTAKKAGRITRVASELLEDAAVSVADVVARQMAESYAKLVDQCYIIGDGTSTYGGFSGLVGALPSGAYIAQGTSNTWSAQVVSDFTGLMGSVENVDSARLAFICSRQYYFQVMMKLDVSASQFKDLRTGNIGNADGVFLGYPVYFSQVMPTATATSQKCVYFGDFAGGSMIGERRDMRLESSDQRYWDTDEIGWKATARFAVDVHGDGKGSTYGPIVALKTS
jgi:HK97 family phage major capsid protein